jgi:Bestrophin, RFP-TM, chloride channel
MPPFSPPPLFMTVLLLYSSCVLGFSNQKITFHSQNYQRHHFTTSLPLKLLSISFPDLLETSNNSNNVVQGEGRPSNVGWTNDKLNRLTEWADSSKPNRPIICEYQPNGRWLWFKWNGTVLKQTWPSVVGAMFAGLLLHALLRWRCAITGISWPWYGVPPIHQDPLLLGLTGVRKAWEFHLTIATFILTFFSGQTFSYWKTVYDTVRKIQGRINDFCMLLVLGAQRGNQDTNVTTTTNGVNAVNGEKAEEDLQQEDPDRSYSKKSRQVVQTCTRLIRMAHIFFWAATPTASNGLSDSERFMEDKTGNWPIPIDDQHIGPILLSPYGLKALVKSGQLTKQEAQDLNYTQLPPSQYGYILLVWTGMHLMKGIKEGHIHGGSGLEQNLLNQLTSLRACMFDIDDLRAGRMPLAKVQLVQVLVDSLVIISPLALYAELGVLSIPLVGLLAFFFRGLLTLSKSFLDPFGVEGFEEQNIRVDVLVSELNFGASKRWIQAGTTLPMSPSLH